MRGCSCVVLTFLLISGCASQQSWELMAINDCRLVLTVDGVHYETAKSLALHSALVSAVAEGRTWPRCDITHVEYIPGTEDITVQVAVNGGTEALVGHKTPVKTLEEQKEGRP